jgi:hypothetical protein
MTEKLGKAMGSKRSRNRVYQIDQRVIGGLRTMALHKESRGPKVGMYEQIERTATCDRKRDRM